VPQRGLSFKLLKSQFIALTGCGAKRSIRERRAAEGGEAADQATRSSSPGENQITGKKENKNSYIHTHITPPNEPPKAASWLWLFPSCSSPRSQCSRINPGGVGFSGDLCALFVVVLSVELRFFSLGVCSFFICGFGV